MLRRPAGGTLPNYDTLTADGGPTMFDDDLSGLSVCLSVTTAHHVTVCHQQHVCADAF